MKVIEGVKVVIPDGGCPNEIKIYLKREGEPLDMTELAIIHWPIDIHIDGKDAFITLRVPLEGLEFNGIAVIEKPDPED